jgi:NADPH-dependent sulfite reductase flavoprotein alpha-component
MVLNPGRLHHQWHTMTKPGRVDKLNRLDSGPFVEVHPDDAERFEITDGGSVELTSRRGRVVLPAVISDRVLVGTCFVPFHWNDEHGADLTINALTNDAVDPVSLQPEFKACAVRLAPVTVPVLVQMPVPTAMSDLAGPLPDLSADEKSYLAGFFTGIADGVPGVPVLPPSAPVRPRVRFWVDGLLAGRYSRSVNGEPAVLDAHTTDGPLVLWASQTGNAEEFATGVAGRLTGSRLLAMDDATLGDLAERRDVVIVTSTFGEGGPPDNGADFWHRLEAPDAPTLVGVRYAVFGIGDRSYNDFCGHAKSLDRRLTDLGATRLVERTECEAYDEGPMTTWADRVIDALGTTTGSTTSTTATTTGITSITTTCTARPRPFTRAEPLRVPLSRNVLLTPPRAAKEVRQFGFDVSEHDVTYSVGDALGVYVRNAPAVVDAWLAATGLSGTEAVHIDGADIALRDALTSSYDLCRVTPNLMAFVAERCRDRNAARLLGKSSTSREAWSRNRNGLDLVEEFAVRADPAELQDALMRLTPRSYSIASSPLVSPTEVQLTVSVVRYRSPGGVERGGVASTFLADRASHAEVFLQPSPYFHPPEDAETPMIMVGPGTGIAPFRGFLQDRRARGHSGRNWLFFGDQHRAENYYYRDDLEDMARDGLLNRLDLAFSRDQRRRVYVQHRLTECGADVWRWLEEGAHFYVCGDATRMAKDVDDTLTTIIRTHGRLSDDATRDYKRELVATKRYVRDVY